MKTNKLSKILATIRKTGGRPSLRNGSLPPCGAYALLLRNDRNLDQAIGALGRFILPSGTHIYVGRASRGLPFRLARHRRRDKKAVWHIDYLTLREDVFFEEIFVIPKKPHLECVLVQALVECPNVEIAIPRFGAGDCKNGCPSHLLSVR